MSLTRPDDTSAAPGALERFRWLPPDDLSLPMLPDQALRVMQLVSAPDVTVTRLAGLISKDPVLAVRVLGLANSAMYGAMTPLRSVQEAVVRLGVNCVRNLVVTLSLHTQMAAPDVYGDQAPRFMDHAIGTAYLARLVAEEADTDVEEAFLTGLLHDIGKLVILKTAHASRQRDAATITDDELASAVSMAHAACGALALHFWKLPDEVLDVVRHHHDYTLAVNTRATAVCYAANRLSHRYGFGCPAEGDAVLDDPVWSALALDASWIEALDQRAPGLVHAARQALA